MKLKLLAILLILTLLFSACAKEDNKGDTTTTTEKVETDEPIQEKTDFRVLLTSDIHCTFLSKWYGLTNEERMQHWVDSVLAEHARQPFDLIIFPGDLSLDFWGTAGSYERFEKSTTLEFIEKYVSQLPADIPKLYVPGNHEAFTNEKWKEITGFDRQFSYLLGNNLFICLDSFGPNNQTTYTPMDVEFIKGEMEKYPDTQVYLVAHHFDPSAETAAFKSLLQKSRRIVGMFQGHTHISDLIQLDVNFGGRVIAQSGHFSFSEASDPREDFWGFRDIVINAEGAVSSYLQVNSRADVKKVGKFMDVPAQVDHVQKYMFK